MADGMWHEWETKSWVCWNDARRLMIALITRAVERSEKIVEGKGINDDFLSHKTIG